MEMVKGKTKILEFYHEITPVSITIKDNWVIDSGLIKWYYGYISEKVGNIMINSIGSQSGQVNPYSSTQSLKAKNSAAQTASAEAAKAKTATLKSTAAPAKESAEPRAEERREPASQQSIESLRTLASSESNQIASSPKPVSQKQAAKAYQSQAR